MMPRIFSQARAGLIVLAVMVLGLTATMAVASVVLYERGYDHWIPGHDRVFRLETRSDAEPDGRIPFTPAPLRDMLPGDGPDIVASVRLTQIRPTPVIRDDGEMLPLLLRHADPGVIPFFGLHVLAGDGRSALDDPDSLILTESEARRIFGAAAVADIAGRSLRNPQGGVLTVRAIIADPPEDSHLGLHALGSTAARMSPTRMPGMSGLRNHNLYTYVRTVRGMSPRALSERLNVQFADLLPQRETGATPGGWLGEIQAVPVNDIHLGNAGLGEMKPPGDPRQVSLLLLIAGFLLVLVFSSYGSYRYGLLLDRLREIGIRKCAGARQRDIFMHFGREGAAFMTLALGLTLALLGPLQPVLQSLAGAALRHPFSLAPWTTLAISALICVGGALASAIPAALLSRQRAGELLHGALPRRRASLRAVLVALQVFVASFLMFSTVLVGRQMSHLSDLPRGVRLDGIHVLRLDSTVNVVRLATWMDELKSHPEIESVSASGAALPIEFNISAPLRRNDGDAATRVDPIPVDASFAQVLGIQMLAGRWFEPDRVADSLNDGSGGIVLGQPAVRDLGYDDAGAALGQTVRLDMVRGPAADLVVIGVVEDVHWGPASDHPRPAAYVLDANRSPMSVFIHLEQNASDAAFSRIRASWTGMMGETSSDAFDLQPLRERFTQLAGDISTRSTVFGVFSLTTLAVSLMGIFGYAIFVADKSRREIAIRRTFGAGATRLNALVFGKLLAPIALGGLCAIPVAWRYNAVWLEPFATKVSMGLAEMSALVLSLALLTPAVAFPVVARALKESPATVLQTE